MKPPLRREADDGGEASVRSPFIPLLTAARKDQLDA